VSARSLTIATLRRDTAEKLASSRPIAGSRNGDEK
jgi:hypothetical protein